MIVITDRGNQSRKLLRLGAGAAGDAIAAVTRPIGGNYIAAVTRPS